MSEDAIVFHDRVTSIFDAYLASVSNRLANVSKVLAVIAALFGPLTVITGLFGMNVPLPTLVGNPEYQFWEIVGVMLLTSAGLFLWFRKSGWW
jgi:magnesium transporter